MSSPVGTILDAPMDLVDLCHVHGVSISTSSQVDSHAAYHDSWNESAIIFVATVMLSCIDPWCTRRTNIEGHELLSPVNYTYE